MPTTKLTKYVFAVPSDNADTVMRGIDIALNEIFKAQQPQVMFDTPAEAIAADSVGGEGRIFSITVELEAQ